MPMITGGFRNQPSPTDYPTYLLSYVPTPLRTTSPNQNPNDTTLPSVLPSVSSSILPSTRPSVSSTMEPSIQASDDPSIHPSEQPSNTPSNLPSTLPPNMSTSHPTTPAEPSEPFKLTYPPSNFPPKSPSTDDPTFASSSIIQRMEQPPNQYGRKPSRNQSRFPASPRQPSSANASNPSTPSGSFTNKPTRSRGRAPSRDNYHGRHDGGDKDAKKKGSKPDKNSYANMREEGDENNQDDEVEHVPGSNSSGPSISPSSAPFVTPSGIPSLNSSALPSLLPSSSTSTKNGTTNKLMVGNSTFTKYNNTELSPSWRPPTFKPTHTAAADNASSPDDRNTTVTHSSTPSFSPSTLEPSSHYPSQRPSMRPTKVGPPSVYPSQFRSEAPSAVPTQEPTVDPFDPSIGSTLGPTVNSTSISSVAEEGINESQLVKGEKNGSTKVSFTLISSHSNGDSSKNSTSSQGENGPHNSQQQGEVSVVKENENSEGEQYEGYNVLDVKEFEDEDNNIKVIINLEHLDSQSPNVVPTPSMETKPSSGGLTKVPTSSPSPQVSKEEVVVPEEAPLTMVFNIGPRNPPSPTPASSPNEISDSSNEKPTKVAMSEYVPTEYSNNDAKGSEKEEPIKMEFNLGPRYPPSPNSAPFFREPTTPSYNGPTKVFVGDYEAKEVKQVEDLKTVITYHRGKVTMKMGPDVADEEKYKYPTYYPTYIPTTSVAERPSDITTFHKDILIPKSPPETEDKAPSFAASSEKRGSSSSKVNFSMSFVSSETREENNDEDSAEKTQTASITFEPSTSPNEKEKETSSTVVNVEKRGSSSSKVNFKIPFDSSKVNEEKSYDGKNLEQTLSISTSSSSTSPPDINDNTPSTVTTVEKIESSSSKVNTKLSYDSSGEFVGKDNQDSEENSLTSSTTVASSRMATMSNFPTSFPTYLIFPTMSPLNEHVSLSRPEPTSLTNSRESPSTFKLSGEHDVLPTPDVPGTPWPTYIPTSHEYISPQRNSPFVSRPSGGNYRPTSSYTSRNPPSQALGAEKSFSGAVSPVPSPGHNTAEPTYYVYPTYYPTTWFPTYIPTSQEPASVKRTSPYGGQTFFARPTSTNQDRKPPSQEQSTEGQELAKDLSRSGSSPHPTFIPTYFVTTNQNRNSTLDFEGSSPLGGNLDIVPGYPPTPNNGYPGANGARSAAPTPFVDASFSWTWAPSFDGKNKENVTSKGEDDNASEMVAPTPSADSSLHWTWAPTLYQNESSTTSAYEDDITQVVPSAMNESYEEAISSLFEKRFCPGYPFGKEPSSQKENTHVLFAYGVQTNRDIEREVAFLQALILYDVASSLLRCSLQTKKSLRDSHPDEFEQYVSRVYYENDGSFYTLNGNCTPTVQEASECAVVESLLYVTVATGYEEKVISDALAVINYKLRAGSYVNEHILRTQYLGPESNKLPFPIQENEVLSQDSSALPATFYAAIAVVVLAIFALISFVIMGMKVQRAQRLTRPNQNKHKSMHLTVSDIEDTAIHHYTDDIHGDTRTTFQMTPPRTFFAQEYRE